MEYINYFFGTDFTPAKEALQGFEQGQVLTGDEALGLVSALAELDQGEGKTHWTIAPEGDQWNLQGATVFYNGANDPDFPTNALYKNVLVLEFPQESLLPTGRLYLQYN